MKKLFLTLSMMGLLSVTNLANAKTVAQIEKTFKSCSSEKNIQDYGLSQYYSCVGEADKSYQKLIKTPKQKTLYEKKKKQCTQDYGEPDSTTQSDGNFSLSIGCLRDAAKIVAKSK